MQPRNNVYDDTTLTVTVYRGDAAHKSNLERKSHPSYDTSIKLILRSTISITESYGKPHVVSKTFDKYRELCTSLNNLGILIDAEFPRTFKRSVLGLSIGEENLQRRCVLLNNWMEKMLTCSSTYPESVQEHIWKFLSIDEDTLSVGLGTTTAEQAAIVVTLLRMGRVMSAKDMLQISMMMHMKSSSAAAAMADVLSQSSQGAPVVVKQPASNHHQHQVSCASSALAAHVSRYKQQLGHKSAGNKNHKPTTAASIDMSVSDCDDEDSTDDKHVKTEADELVDDDFYSSSDDDTGNNNNSNNNNNGSDRVRPSSSVYVTDSKQSRLMRSKDSVTHSDITSSSSAAAHKYARVEDMVIEEMVVRENLQILVTKGRWMTKSALPPSDHKLHITYKTQLSVVNSQRSYKSVITETFFEKYRDLYHALGALGVGDGSGGTGRRTAVLSIGAPFPRTYKRQSFGFKLSEQQIHHRSWLLHHWVVAVFSVYLLMPADAKVVMNDFFGLSRGKKIQDRHDITNNCNAVDKSQRLKSDESNCTEGDHNNVDEDDEDYEELSYLKQACAAVLSILDECWTSDDKAVREAYRAAVLTDSCSSSSTTVLSSITLQQSQLSELRNGSVPLNIGKDEDAKNKIEKSNNDDTRSSGQGCCIVM